MSKLAVARSPARAALAEAISLVGKIREAIAGREAARRSLPDDLARRNEEIAARLDEIDPSPKGSAREASASGDRIQALIDGAPAPDDDLDAVEKEIATLRKELDEIAAREGRIERHNAQVDADLVELRGRLDSAERDVKRAADVVMSAEGGRDALIEAHARAVAIETVLRKAIEGAASPWMPGSPQPSHSFSMVIYRANRDAPPCLWGTAAERLRSDPDVRIPTVAEALATLPDVAPPAVGAGASAKNAA